LNCIHLYFVSFSILRHTPSSRGRAEVINTSESR